MRTLTAMLALSALLLYASCSDTPAAPENAADPGCTLLPAATGFQWIYADSTWLDGLLQHVHDDTLTVTGSESVGGHAVWDAGNIPDFPDRFLSNCDTVFVPSLSLAGQWIIAPYYIRGSRPARSFLRLVGDIGWTCLSEAMVDTIDTPAGRFAGCTKVSLVTNDPSAESEETMLAPGIGIVRYERHTAGSPDTRITRTVTRIPRVLIGH